MNQSCIFVIIFFFCLIIPTESSGQIAFYDFQDVVSASGVDSNMNASEVTVSNASIAFQNGNDDGGSRIGNSGSWNQGNFSTSEKYLEFTITPDAGYQIDYSEIRLRFGRTDTGPTRVTVQYSLDNFATSGITILDDETVTSTNTGSLNSFSITSSLPAGVTQPLTVRIWGHNASGTGNLRFNNFRVFGNVIESGTAILNATPDNLDNLNYVQGNGPSSAQSFELTGDNLDGTNVTLTAPSDFEISLSETSGFDSSVVLDDYDGSSQVIWVRLSAGKPQGLYTGSVTSVGGDASSIEVSLSGEVLSAIQIIDFDDASKWTAGSGAINSAQTDHTYQDQDWLFTGGPALRNTTSPQDGFAGAFGSFSWRIQDINSAQWIATYQGSEIINKFGFDVRRWNASPNPNYSIEYSFDGGNKFFDTGDIIDNAFLSNSSDWTTYEFEIPNIQHHEAEDFIVRLVRNGGERIMIDNFSFAVALEDKDSEILAPDTQIAGGDLVVGEATGIANAVSVFRFKVEDLGSGDGLPTLIKSMRFIAGPENTADFSELLDRVIVREGGTIVPGTATTQTLTENEILLDFDLSNSTAATRLSIADGESKEIEVRVSLQNGEVLSGDIIQLAIDDNSIGFGVSQESSIFSRNISPIVGNEFEVKVNADRIRFLQRPQFAKLNQPMPFAVTVAATDIASNIDRSYTGTIQLTSDGTMQDDPLTASFVDGIASFPNIVHTELGEGLIQTATDLAGELTEGTSLPFNIRNPLELIISEVADPNSGANGRFVELFNHGVEEINFNELDVYLAIEFNGGSFYRNIQLTGILPPKSYYLVAREGFFDEYGFSANIEQSNITAVASGDGDDTYFLTYGTESNFERIRNFFDIYGEFGVQAISSTQWFYEGSVAYRNYPPVTEENQIWDSEEWEINVGSSSDATPGYGNRDYIYVNDAQQWDEIGLGSNFESSDETTNIEIRSGEVTFSTPILVNDLVVRDGATLIIEDRVTVKGDFVNLGEVIFKSDEVKTAVLGEASQRSRILGEFEVQRYFSNVNRAFRYVSSPVNSTENIKANWQEGQNNTTTTSNSNTTPGFGTHITGSSDGNNGFDATQTGNSSLFTYNNISGDWISIPNTDATNLVLGQAYALMMRGDRSADLNSNDGIGEPTVLRAKGEMHIGDWEVSPLPSEEEKFVLIGNPYQAQVDLKQAITSDFNTNFIYIYDPSLGDIGGYTVVDMRETPVETTPASTATEMLQPGQAFFIETSGSEPSFTFRENQKITSSENVVIFSENEEASIYIELKRDNQLVVDAARILLSENYDTNVTFDDAKKIWNQQEYFAIDKNPYWLMLEKTSIPSEEIVLYLDNYFSDDYSFDIHLQNLTSHKAYLVDDYLGIQVELANNDVNQFSFEVNQAIQASKGPNRFRISFEEVTLSLDEVNTKQNLTIYPNPVSNMLYIELPTSIEQETFEVQVFDMKGSLLLHENFNDVTNTLLLQLNQEIPSGLYLLEVISPIDKFVTKFIKK